MIPIAWDTETELIRPGYQAPGLVCVSLATDPEGSTDLVHWRDAGRAMASLLHDPEVLLIGHNVAYDFAVLLEAEPQLTPAVFAAYDADRVCDTMIRQKLIDIAGGVYRGYAGTDGKRYKIGYSLDDLSKRFLDRPLDKDTWRLRYGELKGLPLSDWPEGAKLYPIVDAQTTLDVWKVQETNAEWLGDQYRQARAALWLKLVSAWGIHTSPAGVRELSNRVQVEYETIARDLRSAGLLRPDTVKRSGEVVPGSRNTKLASEMLMTAYRSLGKPWPVTDGGAPSLDAQSCLDSGDPLLEQYGNLSKIKSVIAKDLPLLERGTVDPIHTRFEELEETGRTGSKDPNIQNIGRKGGVRECFVPRPGYVFVSADYGGLELCTLAQVCVSWLGKSRLAEALNEGLDPHLMVASQLLGESYESCQAGRASGSERVDNARQSGKVANFGFPGGLGAASFCAYALGSYGVRITEDAARSLKATWLDTWPEMADYFRYISSITDRPFPQIELLFSKRFRGDVNYTAACNTPFQGLGSDIAKASGWQIARAMYADLESPLFGCRQVNFVHDEHILEAPEPRAHEVAIELSRIMVDAARPWLPDVTIKAEPVVMRVWSKKAKQVRDAQGRLVPWQPGS